MQDVYSSVRALARVGFVKNVADYGEGVEHFEITPEGMRHGIPLVVPNLDEQVELVRRVICDLQETSAEEVSHSGISRRLVEQVALDFDRQELLKTRSYAEGTLI